MFFWESGSWPAQSQCAVTLSQSQSCRNNPNSRSEVDVSYDFVMKYSNFQSLPLPVSLSPFHICMCFSLTTPLQQMCSDYNRRCVACIAEETIQQEQERWGFPAAFCFWILQILQREGINTFRSQWKCGEFEVDLSCSVCLHWQFNWFRAMMSSCSCLICVMALMSCNFCSAPHNQVK